MTDKRKPGWLFAVVAVTTLLVISGAAIRSARPDQSGLDSSFAGQGWASLSLDGDARANALAIDRFGRSVFAGAFTSYNDSIPETHWLVGRFLATGVLDDGFDLDGWRVDSTRPCMSDACSVSGEAFALAIDAQDRIVVGGGDDGAFLVARYLPGGSPDATFGEGGFVRGTYSRSFTSSVRGLVTLADGRVVVLVGVAPSGDVTRSTFALLRLTPSGMLDATFGEGGVYAEGRQAAKPSALVRQTDGKLIVVGTFDFGNIASSTSRCIVARYKADAPTLQPYDPAFGTAGISVFSFDQTDQYNACLAVALQTDNKPVVAGWNNERMGVARLLTDGRLDTTFDGDGKRIFTPLGSSGSYQGFGVAVDTAGRILVGGTAYTDIGGSLFLVARLLATGLPDSTFGSAGIIQTALGPTLLQEANALALQGDGKAVLAGLRRTNGLERATLARYFNPGDLPTATAWATPTWTPLATTFASPTPSDTPTLQATYTPTSTGTTPPTDTATWTATATDTPTPTPTPTPSPSNTASPTATASLTGTPTATGTSIPTSSPSPTATAALVVSGRVRLERRVSNAGAVVCVGTYCATTAADGLYVVGAEPGGRLMVRHPSYLAVERTLPVSTTATLKVPLVTLLAGDLNQDGKVEVDDAVMIGQRFNLRFDGSNPPAQWLDTCDITDDDVVDIRDMIGVQYNLGRHSPGPWPDN